ncbi:hypothetical protein NQ176_g7974 [Zarea fungicola]|uniref:Uncharacterized protein n=1 Tax=Zarea fungicola TaxID=93591 RepID=A0ACC1MVV8_9HYPO|nr:hypothetical protein NQ176_g7974 [Lecanicillium fungicola]
MSRTGEWTYKRKYAGPQLSHDDDAVRSSTQSKAVKLHRETPNLHKSVLNAKQIMVLNQLQIAQGAFFESYAQEHNRYCMPNTRVKLFQQIAKWAKNIIAEPIFWLNGVAGTGKSTISRTVAKTFADNGQLGASFFFKKGEADRSSLSKFFMTIAADLVIKKPSTAPFIETALDCVTYDYSITAANATEQFQKLLLKPLSKIDIERGPVVIVIDALDECEQEDDIHRLLYFVSRLEIELPDRVRIFMTSRPEEPFRSQFEKIKRMNSRVILREIPVEQDIDLFLRCELSRIRAEFNNQGTTKQHLTLDWPGQSGFDRLLKMTIPLFLVAATICRFIGDERIGTPRKLLDGVLSQPNDGLPELEIVYRSILDNLIAEVSVSRQEQIIQEFQQVVGSIILLASPLSTSSLARLLSLSKDDIDSRLDLLHSVLSIPSAEAPAHLDQISALK